jgi:hypothetical protein
MVNKILICIESDQVSSRYLLYETKALSRHGGAELKPGEKYHIANIIEDSVSVIDGRSVVQTLKNRLCRIHQGDNLVGFFSAENIDKYFQPIEDYRNNIIDKLLNYETKTTI